MTASHQNVDYLSNLIIAANDGIDLAIASLLRKVDCVFFQGFIGTGRARHGAAGFAWYRAATGWWRGHIFRRTGDNFGKVVCKLIDLNLLELARDIQQHIAQRRGLQTADDEQASAHLMMVIHQRGVQPGLLDRFVNVAGEIGDAGRAARQAIQRLGKVFGQSSWLELKVFENAVNVGVLQLQDLVQPVHQFDIRIAAQLAESSCALDGFETNCV